MKRVARDFVPNGSRDVRVAPKTEGGMRPGNARSSYLGSCAPVRDRSQVFGRVNPRTGEVLPYLGVAAAEPKVWGPKAAPAPKAKSAPKRSAKPAPTSRGAEVARKLAAEKAARRAAAYSPFRKVA